MQGLTALITTEVVDQGKRAGIGEEPKKSSNFLLHAHQLAAGVNVFMATVGPTWYVRLWDYNQHHAQMAPCTFREGTGLHTSSQA